MKEYIYEYKNSISESLCDELILLFEENKEKQYLGLVGDSDMNGIVNKNIKDTIDLIIPRNTSKNSIFYNYQDILTKEAKIHLKKYFEYLKNIYNIDFLSKKNCEIIYIKDFLLHKYSKKSGKFLYHNDYEIDIKENKYRLLNFIWYLNDVEIGGETEFFGYYNIKPEKGKLVIFPSEWFFPHTGKIPISNNKYIISSWICKDF